jgi:hypothetical protein
MKASRWGMIVIVIVLLVSTIILLAVKTCELTKQVNNLEEELHNKPTHNYVGGVELLNAFTESTDSLYWNDCMYGDDYINIIVYVDSCLTEKQDQDGYMDDLYIVELCMKVDSMNIEAIKEYILRERHTKTTDNYEDAGDAILRITDLFGLEYKNIPLEDWAKTIVETFNNNDDEYYN